MVCTVAVILRLWELLGGHLSFDMLWYRGNRQHLSVIVHFCAFLDVIVWVVLAMCGVLGTQALQPHNTS